MTNETHVPIINPMKNEIFQIEKRVIQAGTHPADECWYITSDNGRMVEQGPYGCVEDAIYDTRQKDYEVRSTDVQLTFDMVTNTKVIH